MMDRENVSDEKLYRRLAEILHKRPAETDS